MAKLPRKAVGQKQKARTRFSAEYGVLIDLLIELRLNAQITQTQIAEAVGKSQQHVSAWESREREINVIDVWKWCNAVEIKVSHFYELFEQRVQKL